MSSLNTLSHHSVPISNTKNGEVIILNTDPAIDAEATAMLMALHSRSVGGLRSHLKALEERGADNFMANFYVGYGHASIGDCGTTAIFIEGVSMLAAKAIQDWRLYSGQEASTRYIDFATQEFTNPDGSDVGQEIQERWRAFYVNTMPELVADLKVRYPIGDGEKETIYNKAIDARAFDILRGFLPAGSTTNLAWSTNLRQAADAMKYLRHHPLEEVRNICDALEQALQLAHPNSFGHKRYEGTETYNELFMKGHYYYHNQDCSELTMVHNGIDQDRLSDYSMIMQDRPAKTELPRQIAECGAIAYEFPLDFGSYRDIQRHRAVVQRMPLLTNTLGFGAWYLSELTDNLRTQAEKLISEQDAAIESLGLDATVKQYYLPMGYQVSFRMSGDLPALVYLVELRATRFVHQTLRIQAAHVAKDLEERFGRHGLVIHLDDEPDRFDIKRGEHDIQIK